MIRRWTFADFLRWLSQIHVDTAKLIAEDIETQKALPPAEVDYEWTDLRGKPRTKSRGEGKGHRPASQVRGVCVHQMAVDIGLDPERCLNIPAHSSILRDGHQVEMHEATTLLWSGHALNKYDVHLEFSGRCAGIEGDGRTLWLPRSLRDKGEPLDHASEITTAQIKSGRQKLRSYVQRYPSIEFIHTHRQGHSSRVSDPGSRVYREVVLWAIDKLGLNPGPPGWSAGSGKPNPDAWTGEPNGVRYSWRVDERLP